MFTRRVAAGRERPTVPRRGDGGSPPSHAARLGQARQRLSALGTSWDKRLSFEEWAELIDALEHSGDEHPRQALHPRALFEAVLRPRAAARSSEIEAPAIAPPDPDAGRRRFHRYVDGLGHVGESRPGDDVCAACPVTAHGIEIYSTVRTMAGLIYVSRMRAGTHIAAHRGPTNLRVRCHLPIEVPEGDCAIRVGAQTRRWQEGKCLVFDDHFEHEAWNHTDEDRIVLIVDLWHPGLSDTEVALLEALHGYTDVHARRLNRYWAANAQAARETGHQGLA